MQNAFDHPSVEDIRVEQILHALSDSVRLSIVKKLRNAQRNTAGFANNELNCQAASPEGLPKSTRSFHFKILREAGLLYSERRGVEVVNRLRYDEINAKFPGLLTAILEAKEP